MTAPHSDAVTAALSTALAAGTREAFEGLLTDDVHWGGEHGGNVCRTRTEATLGVTDAGAGGLHLLFQCLHLLL